MADPSQPQSAAPRENLSGSSAAFSSHTLMRRNKYSPRTNTNVLIAAGYKFQEDAYEPREYVITESGVWYRARAKA